MKNCTKLFLSGLVSLVLGMMPAKSWAVESLAYDLEYCDSSSIAGANYLATLDDGTVLGFSFGTTYQYDENGDYVLDENGDYVYDVWALFTGAITETTSLVVPDSVRVDNETYLVISCGYPTEVDFEEAPNVTSLTVPGSLWWIRDIPSTVNELHIGWGGIPDLGENVDLSSVRVYVLTSYYDSFMYCCQEGLGGWSTDYTIIAEGGYNPEDWGEYTIDVPSPGQLGNLLLNKINQWTDVKSLILTGSLNADDLALLSRMTEMYALDLSQTDITSMTGCRGLSNLSTVILPSTVTKIEDYAFYECTSLRSISLPNVEEVGDYAFYKTALESVELPQAKTIGDYAFAGTEEYVSGGRYEYSSQLISIQMPLVTTIGESAFSCCGLLENISMPSVTYIGNYAFSHCECLQDLDLSNVDFIGSAAFKNCYNLTSVKLSDNLNIIPSYCFYDCSLTEINFPSSLQEIGESAFYSNDLLTSIILPEGLQRIERYAFGLCPLETLSIPSTIEYISDEVFYDAAWDSFYAPEYCAIYSYPVVPLSTTAFEGMASTATLYVPAFSVNTYRLHENWYNFDIRPIENDLEKLHFNQSFGIYEYKGLADKVDMTLAYVSEYVNSWTSNIITSAHVNVNANSTLTLGEYVQYQNLYNRKYSYDYDSGYDIYTYAYCTTLITQNEITADKMCTNVSMRDGRWNFISFPYDVNVSDIVVPEGVLWVIRKYSGADRAAMTGNTWQNMTDGMVLKAGEGYIFHCYNEEDDEVCVSFPSASNDAGTLFAYDDVVRTLTEYPSEYAHNRSWNLVGNPYPAYFNTQEIEFDAPITVWNGEGYTAYSLLDDNYVLTPNEAFFVQRPINAATMTFHKEGRMDSLGTTDGDEDYAPSFSRVRKSSVARDVYNFLLADAEYTDRARLVVNEEAKAEYEVNCDASKFMSSNTAVPQLYINDGGVKYAIDERPLGNGVITLGAYFGKAGEHTLTLASNPNEDAAIMLTDRLTGTVTNLATDSYTFTAEAGTSDDRFTIALAPTTDIENSIADDAPISEVYTLDGKLVTDTDNLPAGVYLIKKGDEYVKHVVKE